jgi:hypothetical protein
VNIEHTEYGEKATIDMNTGYTIWILFINITGSDRNIGQVLTKNLSEMKYPRLQYANEF